MTSWLSEDELAAWHGLLSMSAALQVELNRELQSQHGISLADYEVLGRLHDATDARLRTVDLVATLTWEQSRVSHQLARMQRRGLVVREDCESDRRGSVYALTDLGRRAIEQASSDHVAAVRRLVFDHLSATQVRQLGAMTTRVLAALEDA